MKTSQKYSNKKSGFSLIEVLIFVSIISVFFVIAAGTAIYTLRAVQTNEHRILATRYADDLLEFLRSEKESDWSTFITTYVPSASNTYCFNWTIPGLSAQSSSGNCSGYPSLNYNGLIGSDPNTYQNFNREVTLTGSTSQVNVAIVVTWQEYGQTLTVPLNAIFKQEE